jgi:exoribonuclease R
MSPKVARRSKSFGEAIVPGKKKQINPTVKLLKIFGQKGEHEVEMQSIIYEKGFQSEFPENIEAEAEALKKVWSPIPADEIAKAPRYARGRCDDH